jgi:hypothetical protein
MSTIIRNAVMASSIALMSLGAAGIATAQDTDHSRKTFMGMRPSVKLQR